MKTRWLGLGLVLAGCLHAKSHPCTGDNNTSWVCPEDEACASAPTYCGTANEVGACDNKQERDPCSTSLVADGLCISDVCTMCSNDIAGCRYVGWIPMTTPTDKILNQIAFTGFGEAYAVGDSGTLLKYDISTWAADPGITTTDPLISIVAAGADVFALANSTKVYVHANGAWTPLPDLNRPYSAMWADPATGYVFVAGIIGYFSTYTGGTTWSETKVGTASMAAMTGISATDVYAAGGPTASSVVMNYNGATWMPVTVPNIGGLGAIWAAPNGDIFAGAAASTTSLLHRTGGVWTTTPAPAITVTAIWGSSATDVFAVGMGGTILHWDGASWVQMKTSSPNLRGISGSSAAEVVAVGEDGEILRYTGAGWATLAQPGATKLRGVWAAASNEAFAVGEAGSEPVYHVQNGAWATDVPTGATANALVGIWGRSAADVFAVGQFAVAHRTTNWATTSNSMLNATSVWGNDSVVYAAGANVSKFDGATWTQIVANDHKIEGTWVGASGKAFFAEDTGISHLEGTTIVDDVTTGHFSAIWGASESDVFAVGIGDIHHYDGSAWTAMTIPTTATLTGVWGRASDDVFAVGTGNTVLHYHAGLWRAFTSPLQSDLTSVSGAGDAIYATATDGSVELLLDTAP